MGTLLRRPLVFLGLLLVGVTTSQALVTLSPQTRDSVSIRGQQQTVSIYGRRGGQPIVVTSGDGGWIHLGPLVAEYLASQGFFVVGFDARAYLESFTSGRATLKPEDEPGDFKVLADWAAQGTSRKPILIGVSEGAGLSLLAATDPAHEDGDRRRDRTGAAEHQRTGLALEGRGDLPDARRAERADVQHRGAGRSRQPPPARRDPFDAGRVRAAAPRCSV